MRFKLTLERADQRRFIPINYQYELSSAIYRVIERGNEDFSAFLHDEGYRLGNKPFRLFTFSRVFLDKQRVHINQGRIEHLGTRAELWVSFLIDRAAEEFIKGLFLGQQFFLGDQISGVNYQVSKIEATAPVYFQRNMYYRCLSPILIKEKRAAGGANYLDPSHPKYGELLVQNLISKWAAQAIAGVEQKGESFQDLDYRFEPVGKIYKNGVVIKQMTPQESKLIGYSFEFILEGPEELHEIGYYSGFGHLNSQGFGCVEVKIKKL
ncbi:CRISPR-associated endoribonuclease Cas6 [Algoriphagus boritolerans]|uniref:CRISPR-associated endoribonuclease n=1 Tax=Algoriphagus boritolerans DSM 17298 = JCM 18970 TaxID=1120964 RepID=A0A1H5ZXV9_9BACT|nr:CRISPR-associated endoribonuclease Cas6 [Algoriphagus boritolerans]SEG40814.1 CRISPR-associated endoribonuclease Cas6 [Algoriphagus boritolerans DSM 17298 = JCM 18970]